MNGQVLILEDDLFEAQLLCDSLRGGGLSVVVFSETQAAFEYISRESASVLIADLRLASGMMFSAIETKGGFETGLAFAKKCSSEFPELSIVLISGSESSVARQWCEANASNFYLKSQIHPKDFISKIVDLERSSVYRRLSRVLPVLEAFGLVARRLASRHDRREPFIINDEYDVQDLLGALLTTVSVDVRSEETVGSTAGACARIDFVLKDARVIVETKYIGENISPRSLAKQLIIDTALYKTESTCDVLLFFVYDPRRKLSNIAGLRTDIEALSTNQLRIVLIVGS